MKRSPLVRRTPLTRTGPLRPFSAKRRKQNRQRALVAKLLVEERGELCQAQLKGCWGRATDMHEVLRRAQGGDPCDPEVIRLVCRGCHTTIHDRPAEAYAAGLLVHSWETAS
jgi:hypothetical protein